MKKTFFSVLIPNIGKNPFFYDCLDSVVCQMTNNEFEFEILLCDQNDEPLFSSIKSEIDKKYHGLIRTIKGNKKSAYTSRIQLMNEASGKYFLFVDSDDILLKNALYFLYLEIKKTNEKDLYHYDSSNNDKHVCLCNITEERSLSKEEYIDYFLSKLGTYPIWKKCIKNRQYDFYDEDIFMGDDALLTLSIIKKIGSAIILKNKLYFHRPSQLSGSFTYNPRHFDDYIIFVKKVIPLITKKRQLEIMFFSFMWFCINDYYKSGLTAHYKDEGLFSFITQSDYKSRPRIFKKCFTSIKKSRFIFRLNFILLRAYDKFVGLKEDSIILGDVDFENFRASSVLF